MSFVVPRRKKAPLVEVPRRASSYEISGKVGVVFRAPPEVLYEANWDHKSFSLVNRRDEKTKDDTGPRTVRKRRAVLSGRAPHQSQQCYPALHQRYDGPRYAWNLDLTLP